jgi:hypothetical protein
MLVLIAPSNVGDVIWTNLAGGVCGLGGYSTCVWADGTNLSAVVMEFYGLTELLL